jgi:hypothetical protein
MARRAGAPVNVPGSKEAAETILKDGTKPQEKLAEGTKAQPVTPRPPVVETTPAAIPEEENTMPPPPAPDSKAKPAGYNEAGMTSNNEQAGALDNDLGEE